MDTKFKKGYQPWNKGKGWKNEIRNCLECNIQFNPKKKNSKFCTKGCASSYRQLGTKKSMITKINMSLAKTQEKIFTGFKRNINYRLRRSIDWKLWREAVFGKDNFICQEPNCPFCNNKRGVELHPHHIISVKKCLSSDNEDLIFNIHNGITYCKDYHLKTNIHLGGD